MKIKMINNNKKYENHAHIRKEKGTAIRLKKTQIEMYDYWVK
jgi:hypothetical protein